MAIITAQEALQRLEQGNRRFVEGVSKADRSLVTTRSVHVQEPFAVILGCADARVPVEIVFDQGLGELFVIRVAGNIVAPSLVGSIEFAAEKFGTRLVVVLGHSYCGAVRATLDAVQAQQQATSPNLGFIVDRIRPSVEPIVAGRPLDEDLHALWHAAVRANVRASVQHLRHRSAILKRLIRKSGLQVVGAEYCLETGVVDFFEGWHGNR
jgi:carbonic anhydrase